MRLRQAAIKAWLVALLACLAAMTVTTGCDQLCGGGAGGAGGGKTP